MMEFFGILLTIGIGRWILTRSATPWGARAHQGKIGFSFPFRRLPLHFEMRRRLRGKEKSSRLKMRASTYPPATWGGATRIVGLLPPDPLPVKPYGTEYRPDTTYFWIPENSIPVGIIPGVTTNAVVCGYPTSHPPLQITGRNVMETPAHSLLANLLAEDTQSSFRDSDGLISFVNLSSGFVTSNPEFKTGQTVCDKISNFFATLRIRVFTAMNNRKIPPLPGDTTPETQWDPAVTHYMQYLLSQAGGLTNYAITT